MKIPIVPIGRRRQAWLGSLGFAALVMPGISPDLLAQGTLRFTFEEVPINERPAYISLPVGGFAGPATATVYNSFDGVAPYEGQKFLVVGAGAILTPPNGELISGFTVHMYIPTLPGQLFFSVNGASADPSKLNEWQTISATFSSPAQNLRMTGEYRIGQSFPGRFYVDDIQLQTVPEPRSMLLFACGGLALWAFRGSQRAASDKRLV